jgi:hypothetical protein
MPQLRAKRIGLRPPSTALAVAGLAAAAASLSAWPAVAYRPFDGTDAAVADKGEVEIEFQPAGLRWDRAQSTLVGPTVIGNIGFAERWELVLQAFVETPLSPPGPTGAADAGVFLKYVIQPGSLQDKAGPSIAMEFGPLLPGLVGQQGLGFSWSGIVSQRWDWGMAHFNVMTNLTPDQRGELFLGVILEGPSKWKIRPVAELFSDSLSDGTQTYSALVGAIWQVRDNLSFDAAFRHALVNGRPLNEVRAGITFGFSLESLKPLTDSSSDMVAALRPRPR